MIYFSSQAGRAEIWLIGALLFGGPALGQNEIIEIDDSELPAVGELANRTMTPAQEARIGKILRGQLYRSLPIVEDPESNAYLSTLAQRLAETHRTPQEFQLLIVRDSQINAFAMPGGLLAFNTGLMTQARRESELAGVIAHEMAHVTQRHLARVYDQMEHSNLSLLTTLGIVLAGIYQISAILPAAVIGQAAEIQRYLNYTRGNEQEADRIASRMMAKAGIDPTGVADFFEVLLKAYGRHDYSKEMKYLSTHPTVPSRIAEARDRALQYREDYQGDSELFHFIRERLLSLQQPPHERLEAYRLRLQVGDRPTPAEKYGIVVALQQQGNHARALEILKDIRPQEEATQLLLDLAHARSEMHSGQIQAAIATLQAQAERHPHHSAIEPYLAQAYLINRQPEKTLVLLRARIRHGIEAPQTYRQLAEALSATGQTAQSHIALADHYAVLGQYQHALRQLAIAQTHTKAYSVNQHKIDQRQKDIIEIRDSRL